MGQAVQEVSEIRTPGQQQPKVVNGQTRPTLHELEQELDREWFALKRKRHEVGRILTQISRVLVEDGAFSEFLRGKRIPRSTAYDLIADYGRWAKLPAPIRQAAERQQVDLSERKYARLLEHQLEIANKEQITDEQAADVVRIVDQKAKRSYAEPIELPVLEEHRRALMKTFEALHNLVGSEVPANRGARLTQLVNYALYSYQLNPQKLDLRPEPPPAWLFTGIGEDAAE